MDVKIKTKKFEVGTFTAKTGHLVATDPSHTKKDSKVTLTVKKGIYHAFVNKIVVGEFIDLDRIAQLFIIHENYLNEDLKFIDFKGFDGVVEVDEVVCGFFENKPDYGKSKWARMIKSKEGFDLDVHEDLYLGNNYGIAHTDNIFRCEGAWSTSGYGYGSYPVKVAHNKNKEIIAACICYIDEEDI